MIDERQEELAALAAFDLLEGGEKAQFDGEMARNPELRRRVDELRMAANALALAAPAVNPPPALKDRVMASVAARRQAPAPRPVEAGKVIPFPLIVAWAAAACFAVAAAVAGQLYIGARTRNQVLIDRGRLADLELKSAQNRFETERLLHERESAVLRHDSDQAVALAKADTAKARADLAALAARMRRENDLAQLKISTLASLLGNSSEAQAVAVWDPAKQEGVLSVAKLPGAASDQDYELWVIPDGQGAAPIPAGLVTIQSDGSGRAVFRAAKPVARIAKFAVSLERKGGAPAPAGKIVLLSQ
jgi:anti-sigma-K factor RskA